MTSHVILNKYITDTNPLNLGYIEIWGVGSSSISSVSMSVNGMDITPTFTYTATSEVCDQWKVWMVFLNPEMQCEMPASFFL